MVVAVPPELKMALSELVGTVPESQLVNPSHVEPVPEVPPTQVMSAPITEWQKSVVINSQRALIGCIKESRREVWMRFTLVCIGFGSYWFQFRSVAALNARRDHAADTPATSFLWSGIRQPRALIGPFEIRLQHKLDML